jgi:glycine dehydrogenase
VLENPGWYTAYTPYQAEVAQGRLQALLNFQQMVIDLTGLSVANASLLDEATAAAEAMAMCRRASKVKSDRFVVSKSAHPQVIAVIRSRASGLGITVDCLDTTTWSPDEGTPCFGVYLQTPDTEGRIYDYTDLIHRAHSIGAIVCVGTDLLALMLTKSPGQMDADIAIGSAQRFGVPMGYGGPHAAFMATRESMVRMLPGRVIGVSVDAHGDPALRMALQTREQHIRRDKATSNICTAQALLANMASFYAVYHGPAGLRRIAMRTNAMVRLLGQLLSEGSEQALVMRHAHWFDTVVLDCADAASHDAIAKRADAAGINLRDLGQAFAVSLDETVGVQDVAELASVLTGHSTDPNRLQTLADDIAVEPESIPNKLRRTDDVLSHPVFTRYQSETEFVRYVKRLENKDISLVHSMIPLGSCTMKLNAASEMAPVSWPQFANMHPFAPPEQAAGYVQMHEMLGDWLAQITGFSAVSFQPNSGAQGEYAGLLAIRGWHQANEGAHRNVCLIPSSAHGTNPASAQMAGMKIVVVACDDQGNIDLGDLSEKIARHGKNLAALMVTYPSTHGVFEANIGQVCEQIHDAGGQVYMDGANLNAQAGLTSPGHIGADVCHMNLHKTFCIPHGGGGPGMGPIAVASHLAPFLPTHPFTNGVASANAESGDTVSAAPFGSALISTISWMYIRMMGGRGIRRASELAIIGANYLAERLQDYYPVLYRGEQGRVAHECILDMRDLKSRYGVSAEDIAKRLMDYGFHAPTMSFPVTDTLMIEPTESESKAELDRFSEAMIAIHGELEQIASGELDAQDSPLHHAPHTARELAGEWAYKYTRETATYPLPWVAERKFWPSVKRIDNVAGDRNLVCTCPPLEDYVD